MAMQVSTPRLEADRLRKALAEIDALPLALALIHLTGDEDLLASLEKGGAGAADALGQEIRETAVALLQRPVEKRGPSPRLGQAGIERMVRLATDSAIDAAYVPMLIEQAGFDAPQATPPLTSAPAHLADRDFQVVIIGAGMSGICAAIELKRQGIPFVIIESSPDVGGTWFKNRYPGCGVDTPSFFYTYSFEPNAEWSRYFASREEILDYFKYCVEKYRIREHIRFETEVVSAEYREKEAGWRLEVRGPDGHRSSIAASVVIAAVGQLNVPARPNITGLDDFAGTVIHTAEWHQGIDVAGKRAAMIGAGASAMQVAPTIAPDVAHLSIFQRSPHWVLPNTNYHREISADVQWVLANFPFLLQWQRLQLIWSYGDAVFPALKKDPLWPDHSASINALSDRYRRNMLRHLQQELADFPELQAKSTPAYPPYGKRVLLDNNWFTTLKRPNVSLVTECIERIEKEGVRTQDGTLHPVDVIILATGFQATRMLQPIEFTGRGNTDLQTVWKGDDPRAYLGMTVPKFPNLFILYGPNTNLGYGGSAIFHSECQVRYVTACIRAMVEHGWASLECRQDIHDTYNAEVDKLHADMVWSCSNVNNWYTNSSGRVSTNSPWRLLEYWTLTQTPNFENFEIRKDAEADPIRGDLETSASA